MPTGTVSILNDDPPPSLGVGVNGSNYEGNTVHFYFGVTTNPYYGDPITVDYATSSGSATSGVDFVPVSGTAVLSAPYGSYSLDVQTIQDSDPESDETVILTISNASSGAPIITPQAIGTIKNDDIPPSTGPVANTDSIGTVPRCSEFQINPVLNDTDPGGNYPLSLISAATGAGYARNVVGNMIYFTALTAGTKNVQYVVSNAVGGQATGIITFTVVSGPSCAGGTNAVPSSPVAATAAESGE